MKSLKIGLRALTHPLTLLSIGVLLVNDHMLKVLSPSGLTGKLSDFAGLFFFPFVLIILLSLLFKRFSLQPRHVAAIAFVSTTIGFLLIKTTLWANTLFVSGMERLLGLPVQIIQDPTDLVALVALWPAWLLWCRIEQIQSCQPPGKMAYIVLGLASIASIASGVCHYDYNIVRLVSHGSDIYAASQEIYDAPQEYVFVRSQDGGRSWEPVLSEDLPPQVLKTFEQDIDLPKVLCAPEDPQTCYRVTGEEIIESSGDGGDSWHIVWEIPPGRRQYMQRVKNIPGPPNCGSILNIGPHDIAIIRHGNSHIAMVAMGTQGVVVRSPDGIWQRFSVMNASPIPYRADTIFDAFLSLQTLPYEFSSLAACSILMLLGFNIWGLTRTFEIRRLRPTIALGSCILLAIAIFVYFNLRYGDLQGIVFFVIAIPLTIIWIVISIVRKPKEVRKIGRLSLLIAAVAFILGWMPFVFWVRGSIPHYWFALFLSIYLVLFSVGVGRWRMSLLIHQPRASTLS